MDAKSRGKSVVKSRILYVLNMTTFGLLRVAM